NFTEHDVRFRHRRASGRIEIRSMGNSVLQSEGTARQRRTEAARLKSPAELQANLIRLALRLANEALEDLISDLGCSGRLKGRLGKPVAVSVSNQRNVFCELVARLGVAADVYAWMQCDRGQAESALIDDFGSID